MLKVKFWRIENVVLMKVLDYGDGIKFDGKAYYYDKQTQIKLHSGTMSIIDIFDNGTTIFINDTDENELDKDKIVSYNFFNVGIAKDFYNRAVQTVRNYNNATSPTETPEDVEFEFTIVE